MLRWNIDEWHSELLKKAAVKVNWNQYLLDVGCGDGKDSELLSKNAKCVVGVDVRLNSEWVGKDNIDFVVANVCSLPFKANSFDIVFEKDALHHVRDPQKALAEMSRVTAINGQIIVIEANRYNPFMYMHMTLLKGHQHLTRNNFKNLVKSLNSSRVTFASIESHVYPINNGITLRLLHFVEAFLEKVPLIRSFLSYNIGIVKKGDLEYDQ